MGDPESQARFLQIGNAASAGLKVAGTFASAMQAKNAAKANASYAEAQAKDALVRGQTAEVNQRQRTAQLKGSQRASMGASGIAIGSDSSVNVLTSTDVQGEIDANTIRQNAQSEAWGDRLKAANFRAEAAANNPFLAAVAPALAGATDVASKWYQYKEKGVTGGKKSKSGTGTPY